MKQRAIFAFCLGLLAVGMGGLWQPAWAQSAGPAAASRAGHGDFGFGFGPLLSTESGTIMGMEFYGDYFLTNEVSVGPLLQLGFDSGYDQEGGSIQLKYTFDLSGNEKVHPNLQGGLGIIHASDGDNQTDFLLPLGGGIDVEVAKHLFLNTTFLLNITGLNNETYVSWFFGFRVEI
jgi:hypothetical protein